MMIKKITILVIAMLAFANCKKDENGFVIDGKIDNTVKLDSIFIYEAEFSQTPKIIAVAPVIDGKFTIKGKVDTIRNAYFGNIKNQISTPFIIENATYKVDLNVKDNSVSIQGGEIYETVLGYKDDKEYVSKVKEYFTKLDELYKDLDVNREEDKEALKKASKESEVYAKAIMDYENNKLIEVIESKETPTIAKALALIASQNWTKYPPLKRKEMLLEYKKELGNHPDIRRNVDFINQQSDVEAMAKTVTNGNPFKEVEAINEKGEKTFLSDVVKENKYTILEFWASWCSPCRGEIPNLKKAYKKFKNKGLEIYSVSIDGSKEDRLKALEEEQTTWLNSIVEGEYSSPALISYGLQGIPASFLINNEGVIVASDLQLRGYELDKTLTKFFSKDK